MDLHGALEDSVNGQWEHSAEGGCDCSRVGRGLWRSAVGCNGCSRGRASAGMILDELGFVVAGFVGGRAQQRERRSASGEGITGALVGFGGGGDRDVRMTVAVSASEGEAAGYAAREHSKQGRRGSWRNEDEADTLVGRPGAQGDEEGGGGCFVGGCAAQIKEEGDRGRSGCNGDFTSDRIIKRG